jgi:hypothetical protein
MVIMVVVVMRGAAVSVEARAVKIGPLENLRAKRWRMVQ